MTEENFASRKAGISEILLNDNRYVVPPYQRDYSWEVEQLDKMWDDLIETTNSNQSHFLGSMIFQKSENDKEYIVIDGQQRLATITILLAVIRDLLVKRAGDHKGAIRINQNYILKEFESNEEMKKLELNLRNKEFFYNCIQKFVEEDNDLKFKEFEKDYGKLEKTNKKIKDSYLYFEKKILEKAENLDSESTREYLNNITKAIRGKLILIEIIVGSEEEAYLIFETINDRGLDLSVSDLFKNYLIRKSSQESRENIVKIWNEIASMLDDKIRPFLLHYWLYKYEDTTEKKLFSNLHELIEKKGIDVNSFISDLKKEAIIYSNLSNPSPSYWDDEEIIELLEDLNTLGITQCMPILMSSKYHFSRIPNEFKKVIKILINFTFRYRTICNFANNTQDRVFKTITKKLRSGEIKHANQISYELRSILPNDNEFQENFIQKDFRIPKIAKYILKNIELKTKNYSENLDFKSLTLEHIFPKTPDSEWSDYLRNQNSTLILNSEKYLYKIGNMTLLDLKMNKGASNFIFTKKRDEYYSKSCMSINASLTNIGEWNENIIDQRTEEFAKKATHIWVL